MNRRFISVLGALACVAVGAAALSSDALAQDEGGAFRGWGPTVGLSTSPDQFTVGAVARFALTSPISIHATADLGFGDDQTLFGIGPSVVASAPLGDAGSVYGGVHIAFQYISIGGDVGDRLEELGLDTSDTEFGVAFDLGYMYPMSSGNNLIFDAKVELADYPDFRATIGYEIPVGR